MVVFRLSRLALNPSTQDYPDYLDYHPKTTRQTAIRQLWLLGWSMKDVSRLANMPLVEVARLIGSRTRGPQLQREPAVEDDPLDALRKSKPAVVQEPLAG